MRHGPGYSNQRCLTHVRCPVTGPQAAGPRRIWVAEAIFRALPGPRILPTVLLPESMFRCGRCFQRGGLLRSQGRRPPPPVPLNDPKCPVLCLVDHLRGLGWNMVFRAVDHTRDGPKVFDGRELSSRGPYLRCLMSFDRIFGLPGAGDAVLSSKCSQAFYELMILKPWWAPSLA